jgi:citrate synthase
MSERKTLKVELRDTVQPVEKASTQIWKEIPSKDNPYIAEKVLCHGYELLELSRHRDYIDILYLLFLGELPDAGQHKLLESLAILLCNPGPRHNATRAAMMAGAGKTQSSHILPVSLSILSGAHLGAAEVQASMQFLKQNLKKEPIKITSELCESVDQNKERSIHIAPGYGAIYGGIDLLSKDIANEICNLKYAGAALKWGNVFSGELNRYGYGWLSTGIAAATFVDMDIDSMSGAALYQLISAPGLLAHGLEMCKKPGNPMPFLSQEFYIFED